MKTNMQTTSIVKETAESNAASLQVDALKCERCGTCVRVCLTSALVEGPDGRPRLAADAATRCFGCQHCFAVCPTGALRRFGKKPEDSRPIKPIPTPEETAALIRKRRSVRFYERRDVEREIFDRLREATAFSPTGCNARRLFFSYSDDVRTTDGFRVAAARRVLEAISQNAPPTRLARFVHLKERLESGVDVFFRGAPHFVAVSVAPDAKDAQTDPIVAAAQFELLANACGLGTCWSGMAVDLFASVPELFRKLNAPENYEVKAIVLFGRPAVEYVRAPQPEPFGWSRVEAFDAEEESRRFIDSNDGVYTIDR